jgi:hypothetical protein
MASFLFNSLQSKLNVKNNLPGYEVDIRFTVNENDGLGNCLFLAVCQQDNTYTHKQLRQKLCEFYKTFNWEGNYPQDSLEQKLVCQHIVDNTEYHKKTGRPNKISHVEKIGKNGEYAGIMDIIGIAILLQRPIIFFNKDSAEEDFDIGEYVDNKVQFNEPILLKFNGSDHFEALEENKFHGTHPSPPKGGAKIEKTTTPSAKRAKTEKTTTVFSENVF